MDYEKNDILRESKQLYGEINSCITDIVNARIAKDLYNEGRAIFRMEGLMVGTMQHLGCVIDFLEQGERVVIKGKDIVAQLERQKEQKPAGWSEEDWDRYDCIIDVLKNAISDPRYNEIGHQEIVKAIQWLGRRRREGRL